MRGLPSSHTEGSNSLPAAIVFEIDGGRHRMRIPYKLGCLHPSFDLDRRNPETADVFKIGMQTQFTRGEMIIYLKSVGSLHPERSA